MAPAPRAPAVAPAIIVRPTEWRGGAFATATARTAARRAAGVSRRSVKRTAPAGRWVPRCSRSMAGCRQRGGAGARGERGYRGSTAAEQGGVGAIRVPLGHSPRAARRVPALLRPTMRRAYLYAARRRRQEIMHPLLVPSWAEWDRHLVSGRNTEPPLRPTYSRHQRCIDELDDKLCPMCVEHAHGLTRIAL